MLLFRRLSRTRVAASYCSRRLPAVKEVTLRRHRSDVMTKGIIASFAVRLHHKPDLRQRSHRLRCGLRERAWTRAEHMHVRFRGTTACAVAVKLRGPWPKIKSNSVRIQCFGLSTWLHQYVLLVISKRAHPLLAAAADVQPLPLISVVN